MNLAYLLLGALLGAVPLAAIVYVQRRRMNALRRQWETATADLQNLQQACSRLAPGNAVDRLLADGAPTQAQRIEATALFADLVGYTALSERLEPALLAEVLNGYLQRMSEAITEHRGHVSTFLGDGILAYFGALEPNPWQCDDAAHAALAMRAALEDYNRELVERGLPRLGLGIGLHRGSGIVGWIGSRDRMEYAFVGRTVNLAARLQSATRVLDADILITDSVKERLAPRFQVERMPLTEVKGIEGTIATFALRGLTHPTATQGGSSDERISSTSATHSSG